MSSGPDHTGSQRDRGRTVFFRDDHHQHWLCQEFVCVDLDNVRSAFVEFSNGSRVVLHLDGLSDDELRETLRLIDGVPPTRGKASWVRGSMVIVSPRDAPPPMPVRDDGDPSGDRFRRIPVVPLGEGTLDLPEPREEEQE